MAVFAHRNPARSKRMQYSPDPDTALNENQAADFLGASVRTLQAWRVRGGGPRYVKIGRSVRYQRRELMAFQKAHTVGSTSETDAPDGAS
jgi:predicted DNA-binding transcriptional regulator AlpA